MMVSIDPGIRALGWARWVDRGLVACGVSRARAADPSDLVHLAEVHASAIGKGSAEVVVLESMEAAGGRVPPQDLLDVQTVGVLTAARVGNLYLLHPSTWKGSIPKEFHQPRFRAVLDRRETEVLDRGLANSGSHAKEVLDAVGLGLYYLTRTNRSGGPRR